MAFVKEARYADEFSNRFGQYDSTFSSDSDEVRALLFRRLDSLVAYIYFANGKGISDIKDNYLSPLKKHAADLGMDGKLKIIYSEN